MVGRFTLRRAPVSDVSAPEQAPALAPESALWTLPVSPSEQTQPAASESPLLSDKLLDAKVRLHRRLIEEINLSALDKVPEEEIRTSRAAAGVAIRDGRAARTEHARTQ
jgi:pilus assembly protein CpaF